MIGQLLTVKLYLPLALIWQSKGVESWNLFLDYLFSHILKSIVPILPQCIHHHMQWLQWSTIFFHLHPLGTGYTFHCRSRVWMEKYKASLQVTMISKKETVGLWKWYCFTEIGMAYFLTFFSYQKIGVIEDGDRIDHQYQFNGTLSI